MWILFERSWVCPLNVEGLLMNLLSISCNIIPPLNACPVSTNSLGILWFEWVYGTYGYIGIRSHFASGLLMKASISNAYWKLVNILLLMCWFVMLTRQNSGWRLLGNPPPPSLKGWVKLNMDDSSLGNQGLGLYTSWFGSSLCPTHDRPNQIGWGIARLITYPIGLGGELSNR